MERQTLSLVKDYLSERKQRIKVGTAFRSWSQVEEGVPQGSVLGPLLFSIYINDLFWFNDMTGVCNFADDTTFYRCSKDIKSLIQDLEHDTQVAIEWFGFNYMKLNPDKCHFLFSGHCFECQFANVGPTKIWKSQRKNYLGYIETEI